MRGKPRLRWIGVVCFALLIPSIVFVTSFKSDDSYNAFDRGVLRFASPLQSWVDSGVFRVSSLWQRYVFLWDVKEENIELRAHVDQLKQELHLAHKNKIECKELQKISSLSHAVDRVSVIARVSKSKLNNVFRVSEIEIESNHSLIKSGMAVLSADGLVGRIGQSNGQHADVVLISDPRSSIDVLIGASKKRGILSGVGNGQKSPCRVEYIEKSTPVKMGDKVYTSGLGEALPGGLLVGMVTKIDNQKMGLYQDVVVMPTANLASLTHVMILVENPPAPDLLNDGNTSKHGLVPL